MTDIKGMSVVEAFRIKARKLEELREQLFDDLGFVRENPDYARIRKIAVENVRYDHIVILECDRKIEEEA